jgi:hypothetical protein
MTNPRSLKTQILIALSKNKHSLLKKLLNEYNAPETNKIVLLTLIESNKYKTLKKVVENNLNYSLSSTDQARIISEAIKTGNNSLFNFVMTELITQENLPNLQQYKHSFLHLALSSNNSIKLLNTVLNQFPTNIDFIKSICKLNFKIKKNNLLKTIINSYPELITNISVANEITLEYAKENNHEMVEFMLSKNSDINIKKVFLQAILKEGFETIKLLQEKYNQPISTIIKNSKDNHLLDYFSKLDTINKINKKIFSKNKITKQMKI